MSPSDKWMSFSTELKRNRNPGGDAEAIRVYLGSEHLKASVRSEKQIEADGS